MKFNDLLPNTIHIHGYEIYRDETNPNKYILDRYYPLSVRKDARLYIKGLKQLYLASKEKGFFERSGEAFTGRYNTVESKFNKLSRCCSCSDIVKIGSGSKFFVESYVNGSYTISLK